MVESTPTQEPRIAQAVARLLARQAQLLATAADDQATARAARLGLAWLADLLRSFSLLGASEWFLALRARSAGPGDRPSAAWSELGRSLCEALAADVGRTASLAPLSNVEQDWPARLITLEAFVEPAPKPSPAPDPPPEPGPGPSRDPAPESRPSTPPENREAAAHARVFDAIADFAGNAVPDVDANHDRVEIWGQRPLTAAEPDLETLVAVRSLDAAVRAGGAVLHTAVVVGNPPMLGWHVRLPKPRNPHYLYFGWRGRAVAVPWHRVIEHGVRAAGEAPRIVVGNGLERVDLKVDWLIGKAEGTRLEASERPEAADSEVPAGFVPGPLIEDPQGRIARVLEMPLSPPPPLPPPAVPAPLAAVVPAPPPMAAPVPPPPAPTVAPPAEAVQPAPVPADNQPVTSPPGPRELRALVADDSFMARVFLARLLAQRGIQVDEAVDGPDAAGALARMNYDLAFLDAEMPGGGAIEILTAAEPTLASRTCVLVKDEEERRRIEAQIHVPVLYKPFAEDEVQAAVEALLLRHPRSH
jgi:CheY-like chemotaxis protein